MKLCHVKAHFKKQPSMREYSDRHWLVHFPLAEYITLSINTECSNEWI
jgi:hypothetical protein